MAYRSEDSTMTKTSTRVPSPEYPFPAEDGMVAHAAERVAEAAAGAREQLAEAAVQAQVSAEAFRDTAAGYIRCYPFRSVAVAAALGFLVGLLAAGLPGRES
jgi:ElaB/YqjD/DUF883 family membrane-anchored ribosome-binding protein